MRLMARSRSQDSGSLDSGDSSGLLHDDFQNDCASQIPTCRAQFSPWLRSYRVPPNSQTQAGL